MAEQSTPEAAARLVSLSSKDLLEHSEWLRRLALALLRDPDEASDLAQDAMEAALSAPPRSPGPIRPWLAGVLRNLARMRRRTDGRRSARERAAHSLPQEPAPSPEILVERARAHQEVARLVLELEEPFRQTLLLRYYEGFSAAEIARSCGIPAGTVRWRIKRALELTRSSLDAQHNGDRKRWALMLAPLGPMTAAPPSEPSPASTTPSSAPSSPRLATASLATGAILMKTSHKFAILALLLSLGAYGTHRAGLWGEHVDSNNSQEASRPSTEPRATAAAQASPMASPGRLKHSELHQSDPVGALRLEGQVVDSELQAVAGATVAIDTHPPRTAVSGADGSFAFEGLIGRDYGLEARADDGFAGPVYLRLTEETEPVILRVREAATVHVDVFDAADGALIEGAMVEVRSWLTWSATTGDDGSAELAGVGAREPTLRVSAPGYATVARRIVFTSGELHRERVGLSKGAAITGTVVDDDGKPIADARVLAIAISEPFPVWDPSTDGVVTDAKGAWRFEAVAAGSYRFTASHPAHAPGSTPPMSIDGEHERAELEITLRDGAVVTGKVRAADGTPVVGAALRLVAQGTVAWRTAHRAYTDDRGAFTISGLPHRSSELLATHATGSSPILRVELDQRPQASVELEISIAGVIAGVVVDEDGREIAEAQVLAEPVWKGGLGEREAWTVRGEALQIADGAGRFRFAGLPAGSYRLRAARPGAPAATVWLPGGTVASTGAAELRLVVPEDGAIKGRVAYADGSAPQVFTVAIGAAPPVPIASEDGSFQLQAPGGKHNLTVAGPSFTRTMIEAKVSGGASDLGTITVTKGRSLSGRVLDASGAPVADAMVAAGALLSGDGSKLYIADESINAKTATTDAEGRFVIAGFGPHRITAVAGKDGAGRSLSINIPPGPSSAEIDLVLAATGSLAGTMSRDGKPLAETIVIANPLGATSSNFFVTTGADGSYALDALSAGEYLVYPMLGGGGPRPKDMFVRSVRIEVGQQSTIDIAVSSGDASLEISAITDKGGPVLAAQVFAFDIAGVSASTAELLRDGSFLRGHKGDGPIAFYLRSIMGAPVSVDKLSTGTHSVCVVPLPIDPADPVGARRIMARLDSLPMKCKDVNVMGPGTTSKITVPEAWTVPAER